MLRRSIGVSVLGIFLAIGVAAAQTPTSTPPTSSTQPTTTSQSTMTSNGNEGSFDKLSPGNQKIAQALFEAEQTSSPETANSLTLDDIAAMKLNGKGWGEVFHEMKAQGLVREKNLGQVVSRASRQAYLSAPGSATATTGSDRSHEVLRVRVEGGTLQEVEQKLLDAQGGLARGNAAFEARFRDVLLTRADQQKLLADIRQLNQIPEGSRVRLQGQIDGRAFRVDVRNHDRGLEVKLRGIQFGSRDEARAFVTSLQAGADRVRVRGLIDGQRFDARFRAEHGRVEQQFRVKEPKTGTLITTGSGRSHVTGAAPRPESGDGHGLRRGDKSGSSFSSGRSDSSGRGGRGKA